MKKILLLLWFAFLTCSNIHAKKLFVEMEFHNNSIKIDDGSTNKRQAIKGTDGKDLKFTSFIGALNYMSLQGWEFIGTRTDGSGSIVNYGGLSEMSTEVYYIFSKDVTDEELEQTVNNSYKDN